MTDIPEKIRVMRNRFPITLNLIYFNSASSGPLPQDTKEYITNELESDDYGFPFIDDVFNTWNSTRENCAKLIGAERGEISLMPNTSIGLNTILTGLPLKEGDEIILPDYEFPAIVYSAFSLKKQGVKVRIVKSKFGLLTPDMLEGELSNRTRILALSWANFYSGLVNPLKELKKLCDDREIYLVVDATQGLGPLVMNVREMGLDFVACGAQKWLLSPEGTSFIYVSERMIDNLNPSYRGWLGVDRGDTFFHLIDYSYKRYDDAMRFHIGTTSHLMFGAMNTSINLLLTVGTHHIEGYVQGLTKRLRDGLTELGFNVIEDKGSPLSGITTILSDDYKLLDRRLSERSIIVSSRPGHNRISPYFFNTADEIDILMEVLKETV